MENLLSRDSVQCAVLPSMLFSALRLRRSRRLGGGADSLSSLFVLVNVIAALDFADWLCYNWRRPQDALHANHQLKEGSHESLGFGPERSGESDAGGYADRESSAFA